MNATMHADEFLDAFGLAADARRRASSLLRRYLDTEVLTPVPDRSTLNATGMPVQLALQFHGGERSARLVVDPFAYRTPADRHDAVREALAESPLRELSTDLAAPILGSRFVHAADEHCAVCWFAFDLDDERRSVVYVSNQHPGTAARARDLIERTVVDAAIAGPLLADLAADRVELSAVGICPDRQLKLYVRVRQMPCDSLRALGPVSPFALVGLRALPRETGISPNGLYLAYRVDTRARAVVDAALELAMREHGAWPTGVFEAADIAPWSLGPTATPSFLCMGGAPGRARVSVYARPRCGR
jgi:hypothetical protein